MNDDNTDDVGEDDDDVWNGKSVFFYETAAISSEIHKQQNEGEPNSE